MFGINLCNFFVLGKDIFGDQSKIRKFVVRFWAKIGEFLLAIILTKFRATGTEGDHGIVTPPPPPFVNILRPSLTTPDLVILIA